jgi:acyl carrier protein
VAIFFAVAFVFGLLIALLILPMALSSLWYRYHPRKSLATHPSPAAQDWAAARFSPEQRLVAAVVAQLLCEQLSVGFAQLEPHTRFIEDLDMTDLEPVEVVMAIEEEFKIEIP